jgi:hypothetical protein
MYPGFSDYSAPVQVNSSNSSGSDQNISNLMTVTPTGSSNHLNYSAFTSDYNRMLNSNEKRELEMPRELYVNIKLLDVIEKFYTLEKMSETEYSERSEVVLKKIAKIQDVLKGKNPNFNFDAFVRDYGLTNCDWAIQKIKKGKEPDNLNEKVGLLIAGVTSRFIHISDYFVLNEAPTVREVLPMLEELKNMLDKLKPSFHSSKNPFNLGESYSAWIQKLNSADLSAKLDKDDVEDISKVNEFVQKRFEIFLSSK